VIAAIDNLPAQHILTNSIDYIIAKFLPCI